MRCACVSVQLAYLARADTRTRGRPTWQWRGDGAAVSVHSRRAEVQRGAGAQRCRGAGVQSALDRSLGRAFRLTHRRHLGRRGHPRRLVEQPRERRAVLRVQRRTQRTAPCTAAAVAKAIDVSVHDGSSWRRQLGSAKLRDEDLGPVSLSWRLVPPRIHRQGRDDDVLLGSVADGREGPVEKREAGGACRVHKRAHRHVIVVALPTQRIEVCNGSNRRGRALQVGAEQVFPCLLKGAGRGSRQRFVHAAQCCGETHACQDGGCCRCHVLVGKLRVALVGKLRLG